MILCLAAMTALASCNKPDAYTGGEPSEECAALTVTCSDMLIGAPTRGFMEDIVKTEQWERDLYNVTIVIYDSEGKLVTSKYLYGESSSPLNDTRAVIHVPRSIAQTECTVYVMANCYTYAANTEQEFTEGLCNVNPRPYNGDIGRMLSGELYTSGFPMSGKTKIRFSPYGYMTFAHVELKRIMAKVALELRIDPDFKIAHNGSDMRIDEVRLGYIADCAYMFESETVRNGQQHHNVTMAQQPLFVDGWNRYLWYTYERGVQQQNNSNDGELQLTIFGTFDVDGDFTTAADQHSVSYHIPVDYVDGEGIVKRNTCYRISATVKGLGDNSLESSWSVMEWATPPVNETNVGL